MKLQFFKSSPCSCVSLIFAFPFVLGVAFGLLIFLGAYFKILNSDSFSVIFMVGSIGFMFWFILVLILSLAGLILAVLGLARREKRPLIAVLGLLLNGCPLILIVLILFKNRLF